jgi:predicted negative regulator of RcsB-dependent stress response
MKKDLLLSSLIPHPSSLIPEGELMSRRFPAAALVCLLGLAVTTTARAQDRVFTKTDPSKPVAGTIQDESPAGIKVGGKDILAADILDVTYDVPVTVKLEAYEPAQKSERDADAAVKEGDRKKLLASAVKSYEKALAGLTAKNKAARRHLEFKIAQLLAMQAEEDSTAAPAAIEKLKEFREKHPDGWQITQAVRLLAQLQAEREQFDEAEKTYRSLAGAKNVPEDVRQEFELLALRVTMRPGKFPQAQQKLQALVAKLPPISPQAVRAKMYLAECLAGAGKAAEARADLKALLDGTKDKDLKALGHNTLGYCYYENKQYKEALWEFLWTDVIYNQDREEHARALYYLSRVFKDLDEPAKAEECRDRLKDKRFAGLEYQRRAAREKADAEK